MTTAAAPQPKTIHDPISAADAKALPVWFWNVRSDAELARLRSPTGDAGPPARRRGRPKLVGVVLKELVPAPWQVYGGLKRGGGHAHGP